MCSISPAVQVWQICLSWILEFSNHALSFSKIASKRGQCREKPINDKKLPPCPDDALGGTLSQLFEFKSSQPQCLQGCFVPPTFPPDHQDMFQRCTSAESSPNFAVTSLPSPFVPTSWIGLSASSSSMPALPSLASLAMLERQGSLLVCPRCRNTQTCKSSHFPMLIPLQWLLPRPFTVPHPQAESKSLEIDPLHPPRADGGRPAGRLLPWYGAAHPPPDRRLPPWAVPASFPPPP